MKNIYITYPFNRIQDDENLKGWIETFIESLEIAIPRVLDDNPKYLIKGRDFSDEHYNETLARSDIFLLIIDKGFDEDENYRKELSQISKILKLEKKESIDNLSRVYKILRYPVETDFISSEMKSILGYNFYEQNVYNKKIKRFAFQEEYLEHSWNKVLDIAYDIADTLKKLGDSKRGDEKYVFLGETTADKIHVRDEIKRELQHFGFSVLPMTYFPLDAEEFENLIIDNLSRCQFCLQIMGAQYGVMAKGAKYSIPDLQNRIINKYQQENKDKELYRLVWIPSGMKINDQRQNLYLKRLMRDEAGDATEIIEAPNENFKTLLAERLLADRKSVSGNKGPGVYLISEEKESNNLVKYEEAIRQNGLELIKLDYKVQKDLYSNHLKNIIKAESVLIYAKNSNSYWIRSKIRDIIKAPGLGKKHSFKTIGVIADTKFKVKDSEYLTTSIDYISSDQDDMLLDFINKAKN